MLIGMMIVDELYFNFVEGERFHAFCNTLQPKSLSHLMLQWLKIVINCIQVKKKLKSVLTKVFQKVYFDHQYMDIIAKP